MWGKRTRAEARFRQLYNVPATIALGSVDSRHEALRLLRANISSDHPLRGSW